MLTLPIESSLNYARVCFELTSLIDFETVENTYAICQYMLIIHLVHSGRLLIKCIHISDDRYFCAFAVFINLRGEMFVMNEMNAPSWTSQAENIVE